MKITLHLMTLDEKPLLKQLLELYEYEFSTFSHDDINENGYYGYDYLDAYWIEKGRFPYLIRVDDKIAGFALICPHCDYRKEKGCRCFGEFFVMLKYRRKGIGKQVAIRLFNQHRGYWEVSYWKENNTASLFWKKVVEEYSNKQYQIYESNNSQKIGLIFDN